MSRATTVPSVSESGQRALQILTLPREACPGQADPAARVNLYQLESVILRTGQQLDYPPTAACCLLNSKPAITPLTHTRAFWLQLVSQLDKIRDPAALPGWLATATRRECGRVLRTARGPLAAGYVRDAETSPDQQAGIVEQELLAAERHGALREACTRLPRCCQQLISMLTEDPPVRTPRSAPR